MNASFPGSTGAGVTLRADFDDRTVSGGYVNVLIVDGMFDNNGDLGGTVIYAGSEIYLEGAAGADEIISVFHGEFPLDEFGGGIFAGDFFANTKGL